jgi:hypothetical protein
MSGKSLLWGAGAGVVAIGALWIALGRKQEPPVPIAPVASTLAASQGTAKSVKFTIEPSGATSIDMPAPKEHIKATTEASAGSIDVDLANLANTRGEVKIDLTTLSTHTFGNDDDVSQTKHARTWLEVGDAASAEDREKNRWVVYAIRAIDAVAPSADVTKITPAKEGGEDVRVVTLTAKGDLLLHGHKVEDRAATIEARLHYPSGAAPESKPTRIEIKSKEPLRITLAEHDVKPRDTFGKLAKGSLGLLGTKVADVADVTLDLKAIPAS